MRSLMRKDLTGNRYGKLTVLRVDEERTGSGKVYWLYNGSVVKTQI